MADTHPAALFYEDAGSPHFYDFAPSRAYCVQLGLVWLGAEYLANADAEAYRLGFTQEQFDAAMRHAMWHVKQVLTPQHYTWWARLRLAWHFLFGGGER